MSTDYWMLEEDLCRCCHSEGTFQNLAGAFNFGEEEENIYFNMLRTTLDLNVNPVSGPLCAVTFTICDTCINRLCDAASFKRQVIECELKFNKFYGQNLILIAESDFRVEHKVEELEGDSDNVVDLMRDDDSLGGSIELKIEHDNQDDGNEDGTEKQEAVDVKKKSKKTSQKAKAKRKAKSKNTGKKRGRPLKYDTADQEQAPDDIDNAADPSLAPVKSKLELLLTQGSTPKDILSDFVPKDIASNNYDCRNCRKKCADEDSLRQHVYKCHINQNSQVCHVCSKICASKNALASHIRGNHKLRTCPDCNLKFTSLNLRRHRHEVHGKQVPTCGICGYKSWSPYNVTQHQRRVHMNEKNVSCDQCDLKFFDTLNLRRHQIVHSTDRKYECSFCHKKFPRSSTLKLHEKIHTKIKDKVCSVCGKGFVQKASLNFHLKKYHPESV